MSSNIIIPGVDYGSLAPRIFPVAAPAAGAEISFTVPGDKIWLLQAVNTSLVASATAATRIPQLGIGDGTRSGLLLAATAGITANQTIRLAWSNTGAAATGTAVFLQALLQPELWIWPGWAIATTTVAIQAGDQYGASVVFIYEFDYRYENQGRVPSYA